MYYSNKQQSLLGDRWTIIEEGTSEADSIKIILDEEAFPQTITLMDTSIQILEIKILEEMAPWLIQQISKKR